MSERLKRNWPLIKVLAKAKKPGERKLVISAGGDDLIKSICECVTNILEGNVKLTAKEKKQLARHKKVLRNIVDRRTLIGKRHIINQQGGIAFLPAIIAPLVAGLVGSLISR